MKYLGLMITLAVSVYMQAEIRNAVLVIGYNNTRVNDVAKIKVIAKEHLDAITVLCKKSPTIEDFNAADYVVDTDLHAKQELVDNVIAECKSKELNIIAILPFSDQGTQLGASLAKHLGLPGANPEHIKAAIDKYDFREKEKIVDNKPEDYYPIFAKQIFSKEELIEIVSNYPQGVFLKPCQEGNNRGCTAVLNLEDCDRAWSFVEKYKQGGILVEELVSEAQEYSCDNAGPVSWLTLKFTSVGESGKYRGEIGYILPAPESEEESSLKRSAGKFMAELCGFEKGAYHNEIFYKDNKIMAVEPNLRPAGNRIWDSAALAFENFNPWLCWIKTMAGQEVAVGELKRNCYVGQRFIEAPQDGILEELPSLDSLSFGTTVVAELKWTKKLGDVVVKDHRDNSDFLGYVIAKDKNPDALNSALKVITQQLAEKVIIK